MDGPRRITLDDPVFAGRLRYQTRSSVYTSRTQVAAPAPVPAPVQSKPPVNPPPTQYVRHQPRPLVAQKLASGQTKVKQPRVKRTKGQLALYAMAATIFVMGVSVSAIMLMTNHKIAKQAAAQQQQSAQAEGDAPKENTAPSVVKPTAAAVSSYVVAPNLPRYIDIAKLKVHARVTSMSVNAQNQLQAPRNVYDAGWYNASAQPGQNGAMLIDGHISSWTTKGVFYGLEKLVTGDPITVTRGDGQQFTYKVVKTQLFDADKVDMASLLVSQDTAKPGLNLISCAGDVIPGTNEFNKRFVVYAVM